MNIIKVKEIIIAEIAKLLKVDSSNISEKSSLIGEKSILKSIELLELFLSLESKMAEENIEFDWPYVMTLEIENHPAKTILMLSEYISKIKNWNE